MKKLILLTLMTVTLLTLAGCNTNNDATSNAAVLTSTTIEIEDAEPTNDSVSNELVETEIVSGEISEVKSSETTDEEITEEARSSMMIKDMILTNDSVVYDLQNTYYNEAGGITVEGYIINVTDHVASAMRLKKLELFNENDELIASNTFGEIFENGGYVDVGDKIELSVTFPSINVYIKGDDLDLVRSHSKFTSEHW